MGFNYSIPTSQLVPLILMIHHFTCSLVIFLHALPSVLCPSPVSVTRGHPGTTYTFLVISFSQALGTAPPSGSSFPFSAAVASSAQLQESQHYPWFFSSSGSVSCQICWFYQLLTSLQPLLSVSRYWSDHHLAWVPALIAALWSLLVCPHLSPLGSLLHWTVARVVF